MWLPMLGDRHTDRLLSTLANSRSTQQVADAAIDALGPIFDAKVSGVFFFDAAFRAIEANLRGMSDVDYDEYERQWLRFDRVLSAMLERQVPVHNAQIYAEPQQQTDPLYADFGRRMNIYRYMCTPLYGSRGELHGMLRVCRPATGRPFDATDLSRTTALGGYISAALARVNTPSEQDGTRRMPILTQRELEVARLVGSGRDNREIALHLGVARETVKQTLRRVYQRLGVRTRAEMTAYLARHMLI
jgi:DNA-binding CsgD family transcriptional regulator